MTEDVRITALRKKFGFAMTIIIVLVVLTTGILFFLIFPGSNGKQLVVLNANGSFSHNCDCVTATQGHGTARWVPSVPGKFCPAATHTILSCK